MQGIIYERERERESLEIVDQLQTLRYVSRFEPLSTFPPSHRRIFTGLPTQGISTEDLGNTNLEYTIPLSTNNNLCTRGKAKQQSHLHLEG